VTVLRSPSDSQSWGVSAIRIGGDADCLSVAAVGVSSGVPQSPQRCFPGDSLRRTSDSDRLAGAALTAKFLADWIFNSALRATHRESSDAGEVSPVAAQINIARNRPRLRGTLLRSAISAQSAI
jgi:hypothetical protein